MGINESVIYGLLALCTVLAGLCLLKKKPLVSTLLGEGAIALAAMSAKKLAACPCRQRKEQGISRL